MRGHLVFAALAICAIAALPARADEPKLTVYGAGSLREAVTEIARQFGSRFGIEIRTEFGPSGRMRERIEHGEKVDVFASADIGHAHTLVAQGRASVSAMFARNTLCVLAPVQAGLTDQTILPRLLDKATRIGISRPKVDPLGDYTVELFDRIARDRAGADQDLMTRSTVVELPAGSPPPRSGDAMVDALQTGRVDLAIVYCSGRGRYQRLMPDLVLAPLPQALQVGPEYALAVLKDAAPEGAAFALYMLSPEGQAIFAQAGFIPVALPKSGS